MEPITSFTGKYAFLSNFYPSWVALDGMNYPTVEHAYQAAKTEDRKQREWVRFATTPGQAKRRGRGAKLVANWEQLKEPTMWYLLSQKFGPSHPELVDRLLATGEAQLIEGNTWGDQLWGAELVQGSWVGQNRLGQALMALRIARALDLVYLGKPDLTNRLR